MMYTYLESYKIEIDSNLYFKLIAKLPRANFENHPTINRASLHLNWREIYILRKSCIKACTTNVISTSKIPIIQTFQK